MIYTPLCPARPLEEEVRRAAGCLLEDAHERLANGGDIDTAVHESRKRLKEVRSLLRLLRDHLVDTNGKAIRKRENEALRTIATGLAEAREAAVAAKTFKTLRKRHPDELAGEVYDDLARRLDVRHAQVATATSIARVNDAIVQLAEARERATTWSVSRGDWRAVEPGLIKAYGEGRDCLRSVRKATKAGKAGDVDPEVWDDWRKRAKDLRYALEYLRDAHAQLVGGLVSVTKSLTDALGDDHDLAELDLLLRAGRDDQLLDLDASAVAKVGELAHADREALQADALVLGWLLYVEKGEAFAKRLGTYWTVAAATGAEG